MANVVKVAIRTYAGNYVTAINGGGIGEDANALPIHTDASVAQDWEKFWISFDDEGFCLILTIAPYYLTAVNGGGMAAPAGSPVATDATEIGQFETFTLEELAEGVYAFKTFDGHYLTAVNGGGLGTAGAPLHTDQTAPTEPGLFMLVGVKEGPPPQAPELATTESESCEK